MRETILITGGTGMLGERLLQLLCEQELVQEVIVLARKRVPRLGHAKLAVLYGDIGLIGLGLDEATRSSLGSKVTTIVHGAAETAFSAELSLARSVNVLGTENLLQLAAACSRLRGICCLSTVYVAGQRTGYIREDELEHSEGFVNAYEQSKYEAEMLVQSRMAQLPIAMVRLSTILGDSRNGTVNKLGALHHALRFFYHSLAPMVPGREASLIDLIALDYAAQGVATLALTHFVPGVTWHLCGGQDALTLKELLDLTLSLFYEFRPAWRRRAIEKPAIVDRATFELFVKSVEELGDSTLKDSIVVLKYFAPQLSYPKIMGDGNTRSLLEKAGIVRPHIRDFYPQVLRFLVESNWQPAVQAQIS